VFVEQDVEAEFVEMIGTMPLNTLANFNDMFLDHDTVDRISAVWATSST
jgi:hypothetical protein